MKFDEFEKELKGIKYRVEKKWDIMLPFNTTAEMIQKIIGVCRTNLLTEWHLVYKNPTELNPEPEINMYWDKRTNKE